MALNLADKVVEFLQAHENKKHTALEIAAWVFQSYPNECREKQKRSAATVIPLDSDDALVQQISAEISASRKRILQKEPHIKVTEGRPKQYYYTTETDESEAVEPEAVIEKSVNQDIPLEHDLYPILTQYLNTEHGIHSMRIDERKSTNSRGPKGNEWLYPDVVAMENLLVNWSPEIIECSHHYGDKKAKLWSFEVKRIINTSNIRSAYFQSVSNSSWANLGYLVAGQLDDSAIDELRMLYSLHGIGFILLDVKNPSDSEIIIPAREKNDLDWNSMNRVADANPDFRRYLEEIKNFCLTGKAKDADWD